MQTNPIWGAMLAGTVLLTGCTAGTSEDAAATRGELFYIGTQDTQKQLPGAIPQQGPPVDLRPGGKGIYAARLNPATGALTPLGLVAELERPTWLVASPGRPVLYSVSETGNDGTSEATIHSFSITADTGALHVMNTVSSGGGGATHMAIDPAGQTIFVANFGDGHVAALPVNQDGSLAPPSSVQSDFGTGPTPRQRRPHAHSVALDPSGHFLLAADLGADRIFVYRFDASTHTLSPAHPAFVAVPPGSGPRHLAFTPDGRTVYMDTELAAEIIAFRWNAADGSLMKIQALPISTPGFAGEKSAAELAVSKNGRFVYVSNRGENLVEVLTVDAATGMLSELQRISAGALTPWSFTIDPTGQWMVVCNQGSSQLDVLKIDPATGLLSATGQSLDVPKPVNVTFPLYK